MRYRGDKKQRVKKIVLEIQLGVLARRRRWRKRGRCGNRFVIPVGQRGPRTVAEVLALQHVHHASKTN